MQKETVIENRYTIRQTDQSLTTKILGTDLKKLKSHPSVLEENYLNHWIDTNPYQNSDDEFIVNAKLADDESTVSEFRSSVMGSDLMEFKDQMIPVMRACLEFAYYQEKTKEWKAPLNPLNLIYRTDNEGRGHISAFYRESSVRETIDSQFLDDVVKLITYLFIPEEDDSIERYPDMSGQEYLDSITSSSEFYGMYGDEGDELIDFICSCLSPRGNNAFTSVADIMDNVGAFDEKTQVENPDNHGVVPESMLEGNDTFNLNDYQEENESHKEQEDQKEKALKEQAAELERLEKEKAEKKAKKKAEKEKKKLAKQKELDELKKKQQEEKQKKPADKNKKSKLPIYLVAGLVLGGVAFGVSHINKTKNSSNPQQEQVSSEKSSVDSNDPSSNKYFKKATDAAANSDYKKASDYFDDYFNNGGSQDDLNNDQISRVFNSYLRAGEYQKILDNIGSNDTATALVNYLSQQNQLDKVNDLYGSESIIDLVKAINQKDYNKVVDLASKVSTKKLDQKIQDSICNAFAETNKLQQGKEWAQDQNNSKDLVDAIKAHAYQLNKQSHDDIDKALS